MELSAVVYPSYGDLLGDDVCVWTKITAYRNSEGKEAVRNGERTPIFILWTKWCVLEDSTDARVDDSEIKE